MTQNSWNEGVELHSWAHLLKLKGAGQNECPAPQWVLDAPKFVQVGVNVPNAILFTINHFFKLKKNYSKKKGKGKTPIMLGKGVR